MRAGGHFISPPGPFGGANGSRARRSGRMRAHESEDNTFDPAPAAGDQASSTLSAVIVRNRRGSLSAPMAYRQCAIAFISYDFNCLFY